MSIARPQRGFLRKRLRRVAIWLGLVAASLPAFIPGLHAGHGLPTLSPPVAASHTQHAAQRHASHQEASHHHAAMHGDGERHDAPEPASERPTNGACPICRTLQQIGAVIVPEITIVVAMVDPTVEIVPFLVGPAPSVEPHDPAQPRAPPIDA
jgi:hypothetical protein